MSTLARPSPAVVRVQRIVAIGLIGILIVTSLVLIASAFLSVVSSTIKDKNDVQADLIPVVQNSITPIPVPTSPMTNIRPSSSETSTHVIVGANKSSELPLPVPTPPLDAEHRSTYGLAGYTGGALGWNATTIESHLRECAALVMKALAL